MSMHLEKAVKKLTGELIFLSAQVEESVKLSIKSLVERDVELANTVIRNDEIIDQKEIDIEEECLKIFALHQPVAIDLRQLVMIMKVNNDLERIGDLAQNISKSVIRILDSSVIVEGFNIDHICNSVQSMVKMSIDSISSVNIDMAREILRTDDVVDELNAILYTEMIGRIKKAPENLEILIQYIHIIRHLERIADHTTNIAEDIIYMISGEIVRHQNI